MRISKQPLRMARESATFRATEALIALARRLAPRPTEAAVSAALALGRLCSRLPPDKAETVLGLARRSYEASKA